MTSDERNPNDESRNPKEIRIANPESRRKSESRISKVEGNPNREILKRMIGLEQTPTASLIPARGKAPGGWHAHFLAQAEGLPQGAR